MVVGGAGAGRKLTGRARPAPRRVADEKGNELERAKRTRTTPAFPFLAGWCCSAASRKPHLWHPGPTAARRPKCDPSPSRAASAATPRGVLPDRSRRDARDLHRCSVEDRVLLLFLKGQGSGLGHRRIRHHPPRRPTPEPRETVGKAGPAVAPQEIQRLIGRSLRAVVDCHSSASAPSTSTATCIQARRRHAHRIDHRRLRGPDAGLGTSSSAA